MKFGDYLQKLCVSTMIGVLSLFFAVLTPVFADENFAIDLHTAYRIDQQAMSTVEHQFTVTNKTPTYFINRYGLKLSSDTIKNVAVNFNKKTIPAEVVQADGFTSIGIEFPEQIVGEGKKLNFAITYQNPDNAQINGQVLEVTIPELANSKDYQKYTISVQTPLQYGTAIRSTPQPSFEGIENNQIITRFSNVQQQGVSLIFGSSQVYALNLKYPLENSGTRPILTQITLPPDTPYQRLYYEKIDPAPESMKIDADGNWIATYLLAPSTTVSVVVKALALVTLERNLLIPSMPPNYDHFTAKPYWETGDAAIKQLAADATQPLAIYQTVVASLTYTNKPIEQSLARQGAAMSLQKPEEATCQEYTDLFIALARLNGIPSRRATGYAHTENEQLRPTGIVGDILHAWPEYFDQEKQQWVAVDPTWGDTTGGVDYFHQFDLNHIVFAYQGVSSTTPYPAGSYRPGSKPEKLVDVSFTDAFPELAPQLEALIEPRKIWFLTIPGFYNLVITNPTGLAWYTVKPSIVGPDESVIQLDQDTEYAQPILPYQTIKIPLSAYNMNTALTKSEYQVYVAVRDQTVATGKTELVVLPSFVAKLKLETIAIGLVLGVVALTLTAGSIFVFWPKRPYSVRR
jgi:transglutaminase-like putative cysteine protease